MANAYRAINKPARRRSRNLKMKIEPLFQFRDEDTTFRREGIISPAIYMLGRFGEAMSSISNPAYLEITPAFENDVPLDIKRSDLFIRLKHLEDGEETTNTDAIEFATGTRAKFSLEVHTWEIQDTIFRILGDLS